MPSHAPPSSRWPLIAGVAVALLTVVIIAAQLVGGRVSAHPRAAQQTPLTPMTSPTAAQPAAPTSPDTPSASPIETTTLARTVQAPAATRTVRAVITQPGPTTTVTATATATVTQTVTATSTTTVTQTAPALTTAGGTP